MITAATIVARNELISEEIAEVIQNSKLETVHVRSPMTCALIHGICALCYGRDLGRGEMVEIGSAVGIASSSGSQSKANSGLHPPRRSIYAKQYINMSENLSETGDENNIYRQSIYNDEPMRDADFAREEMDVFLL